MPRDYPFGPTMEPAQFNSALDQLVGKARRGGLSPQHVKNALQAKNREISADEWKSRFEQEQERGLSREERMEGRREVGGFRDLELDL